MSDDENEEYEVEFIREARVESTTRSKKAKLVWKYLVRWKNYTPADDTWEPIESFVGSEHIVEAFWKRIQTGRDVEDLSQFKAGESFRPVGPPKRPKGKLSASALSTKLSPGEGPSNSKPDSETSHKRRRESPEIIEITDWSPIRPRGTEPKQPPTVPEAQNAKIIDKPGKIFKKSNEKVLPSTSSHKKRRTRSPSIEIIPDSDEEVLPSIQHLSPQILPVDSSRRQPPRRNGNKLPTSRADANALPEEQSSSNVPLHQIRKDNPLVKMVDFDPGMMASAIPAKAYATNRSNGASTSSLAPKRTRPGPGRSSVNLLKSSLLTAEKGILKTVKGKYSKAEKNQAVSAPIDQMEARTEENNTVPQAPPSAEELLELAGLDVQAAESLPDFEEGEEIQKAPLPVLNSTEQGSPPREDLLPRAGRELVSGLNMFGGSVTSGPSAAPNASFTRSTIFGPLTMWSKADSQPNQLASSRLFLNLDVSVSIRVILTASFPPDCFSFVTVTKGTPGKFYSTGAALTLLGTVRAVGASAFAIVDEKEATDEEKNHFEHFSTRLENGDLFVAMAGVQILVFCSTSNTTLSQRLNAPQDLLNQPHKILVSRVDVENYSGYADATANADERRWVQYVSGRI
ncbi:hypothetical protein CPB84DRAFT_1073406 [Gymnopilus junonius]|uniref:Chromo domain-containing protein n=1 Tax=Gymnopilus junonius TaxID=109634 RepID=A0A9P5NWH7_GYMJU|nr:hypothetical protein CPB84DRAFT_1073406 [Gymnopilus junonius]